MPIDLSYQDEKLRKICESPLSAKRRLGVRAASTLASRLADLVAAVCPCDLVEMGLARFDGPSNSHIVIELPDDYALVATINHRSVPKLANGELDWKQVSRLKILSIKRANEN